MSGFIQDPIQFVNLIADNLRDRYQSGFPVLKELIQNTDDAPAQSMEFGLSPGIESCTHPLLRGSALFFVNDGEFKASDARGIRSFGQNSKAADQVSIGKFGLGMKSVFHFCEAFFFLANDGEHAYEEVLNPWSGADPEQSLHPDWDEFSHDDAEAIRNHLQGVIAKSKDIKECFVLWLPLRKKSHLLLNNGSSAGAIVPEYPGDNLNLLDFLKAKDLPFQIAGLLPMLRGVGRVRYWNLQENGSHGGAVFDIELGRQHQRFSLLEGDHPQNIELPLQGGVRISIGNDSETLLFNGYESFAWNERLRGMHSDDFWPSSFIRDELGHSREAKDKARPHGAVIFSRIPGNGHLSTQWAVFLPLDEHKAAETVRCSGEHDYRMILHGYFFVDAGRQGIHGLDKCEGNPVVDYDNEESLRSAWNCELASTGVLPLVLPALNDFCNGQRMADKSKSALTQALSETSVWRNYRASIARKHGWIREIKPSNVAWALIETDLPVLSLPEPPRDDAKRPWSVFPALKELGDRCCFTIEGAPCLICPEVDTQWQEEDILDLLNSIDAKKVFSQKTSLEYLVRFVSESAGPFVQTLRVQKRLGDLIKDALRNLGEDKLAQNRKLIQKLVAEFKAFKCLTLENGIPKQLIGIILDVNISTLLIPVQFDPVSSTPSGELVDTDAFPLLQRISKYLEEEGASGGEVENSALKLSEHFVKSVSVSQRASLLSRCAELLVLAAYDCKRAKKVAVSIKSLREAKEKGLLFGFSQGVRDIDRRGLAPTLQKCLPRDTVLLINADTGKLALSDGRSLSPCTGEAILSGLGQYRHPLGGISVRSDLAGRVGTPNDEVAVRGLRYLLHAHEHHFNDESSLWVLGHEQQAVWEKIWVELQGGETKPWNLLDEQVTGELPRNVWQRLGIREIQAHSIIEEFEAGQLEFDSTHFTREECEEVLQAVKDKNVWLSLPLHWSINGCPIQGNSDNVYLHSGSADLDKSQMNNINLIEKSHNPELARTQKAWLRSLDAVAITEILLDGNTPWQYWRKIMDALVNAAKDAAFDTLKVKLCETRWIPDKNGNAFSPQDVIDLDVARSEIDRILAQEPGAFTISENLADEFLNHAYFKQLRSSCFSHGKKGLQQFGLVLGGLADYYIGAIQLSDANSLNQAIGVLGKSGHPGWGLLTILVEKYESELVYTNIVGELSQAITTKKLVGLLQWISNDNNPTKSVTNTFNILLKAYVKKTDALGYLSTLTLKSKGGKWQPADKLVAGNEGIANGHVLDSEQLRILSQLIEIDNHRIDERETSNIEVASSTESCANILRGYFQSWSGRVADPMIAMVALLFGRDQNVEKLTQDYLGNHSVEWLIEQVPWVMPDEISPDHSKDWLYGHTLKEAIAEFCMALHVNTEGHASIDSILGKKIQVPLDLDITNLFVGRPSYYRQSDNNYLIKLAFRRIDVEGYSDNQLTSLLQASSEYLLREVYNQKQLSLQNLWSELDKSDQVDIQLAKSLMLENIPFYLKQLGAHKHPKLEDSLKRFQSARRQVAEFKGDQKEAEYKRRQADALENLQQLIEEDRDVQAVILSAVKQKVTEYQYQPESIPFELFQNADDALHDLEKIVAYPAKPGDLEVDPLPLKICRFFAHVEENQIVFMHWGRSINQVGMGDYPGRKEGFDNDLENMLILSASDKGEDVTGKFGLGFKSVLLATDCPEIVSGRLQLQIVGGLIPRLLGDASSLRTMLELYQPDRKWPGTAIKLPLSAVGWKTILQRFSEVAGGMVAFSRSIRTIEIREENDRLTTVHWDGTACLNIKGVEWGKIRHGSDDSLSILKFDLDAGAIVMAVGAHGFIELPKTFPCLWVTAPIREVERLGFAMNAMFDVDAGRSRLAAAVTHNQDIARKMGKYFRDALNAFSICVDGEWNTLKSHLLLSPEASPYIFWESMWSVLFSRSQHLSNESGVRIISTVFLREAFETLSCDIPIVPNGLPSGLRRLLRWPEISTILKGALLEPEILLAIADSSLFSTGLDQDTAISEETAGWLRIAAPKFYQEADRWRSVSLSNLVTAGGDEKNVSPDDANRLGVALNKNTKDKLEKLSDANQRTVDDFDNAVKHLCNYKFMSSDEEWVQPKDLLVADASVDEEKRWMFAPDRNRLSDRYKTSGVEFFRLCRDAMDAPSDILVEWILDSDDPKRREAGLRYLLDGELSQQVISKLQEQGFIGTWLVEIDENTEIISHWEENDISRLVYQILKTPDESRRQWAEDYDEDDETNIEPIDPKMALENIYEWWHENQTDYLSKYRQKIYPEGILPNLEDDDVGKFDRSSWLILLLLGGFHTIGRTRPEQHRSFLENCQRNGWWEIFSKEAPEKRFDEWMGVLDQYIGQQVDTQDYEQWMMRFPIIYKLSRYLDEYVELLHGLNRCRRSFVLTSVLRPLVNPDQQGGGIQAPPLGRTLGIGGNFIVRELSRLKIMENNILHEHCFVPYQGVQRLLVEMGYGDNEGYDRSQQSGRIMKYLSRHLGAEKATFDNAYDIPLKIVSEDWDLQIKLLGRGLSRYEYE